MKAWLLLWFVLNPWLVFCDPGIYVPGLENASGYSVQLCFNVYVSVQYLCVIMFRLTIPTHLLYGSWLSLNSNDWKKELHIFIFGTIHWSYNFTPGFIPLSINALSHLHEVFIVLWALKRCDKRLAVYIFRVGVWCYWYFTMLFVFHENVNKNEFSNLLWYNVYVLYGNNFKVT